LKFENGQLKMVPKRKTATDALPRRFFIYQDFLTGGQ
jgi:hypothetical protein